MTYFIEFSSDKSIVRTLILQPFVGHYQINLKSFLGTFQV